MLPSKCTALAMVVGAALGLAWPSALIAAAPADAAPDTRVPTPQALAEEGIVAHQLVRQDPAGSRLWWLFDAQGQPAGSLEYRPPAAAAAPEVAAGDSYTLRFKGQVLLLQTSRARVVVQLDDGPPLAFGYDEQGRRLVADAANSKDGFEAARPGLRLLTLHEDGVVRAVAAYRVMDMLYCGRLLYVDDLVTDQGGRSRGYGKRIVARLKAEARALGCSEIQLISRVTREQAHRFYFREGFGIECFHFRHALGGDPEPAAPAGAGA